MVIRDTTMRADKTLTWLLVLYGLTSLVHFVHNAEYLAAYPNLPVWLSRFQIYGAWCGITAVGLTGYILYCRSHSFTGLSLLAFYAVLGFDGLLHYRRAPFAAHTLSMNVTIVSEVGAAALALLAVAGAAFRTRPRQLSRS